MTRFITLTAIVATLAALWLVAFAATPGPVRVLPVRTARPKKVMTLVCELHRVTVLSAYEKLEPALKIVGSGVDLSVAQTTSSSQQHNPSLPEEAR